MFLLAECYSPVTDNTVNVIRSIADGGVQFTDTCDDLQISQLKTAFKNVEAYIKAAHLIQYHDRALFTYFFKEEEWPIVDQTLRNLYKRLKHIGPQITVRCRLATSQHFEQCIALARLAFTAYFLYRDNSNTDRPPTRQNATVGLCPSFWTYPDLPDPCDERVLQLVDIRAGNSKALILLHEMIHAPRMTGPSVWHVGDLVVSPQQCHGLTKVVNRANVKPTLNANNFALLAQWAWIMNEQKTKCPQNFPLWGVLDRPEVDPDRELRKLLGDFDADIAGGQDDSIACNTTLDQCVPIPDMVSGGGGTAVGLVNETTSGGP